MNSQDQSLISQPLRKSGRTSLFASLLLVISPLTLSHSSLPSTRTAIAPSTSHSVYGPAMLKLEQAGAPPLHARIQSRRCAAWLLPALAPGERGKYSAGSLYSAHREPGNRPTPSPRPLVPR